jgi:undecaprenyl-diphosphatase
MTSERRNLLLTAVGVLAILLAFTVDQPIARALAGLDPSVIRVGRFVTWFGQGGVILYPTGILILTGLILRTFRPNLRGRLDGPIRVLAAIFITVAAAGLADDVLKIVFGRARPYVWLAGDESGFGFFRYGAKFASFPSGHTTTSVAAALAFSAVFPRGKPAFLAAALLIAISRMVLESHYLSDVIAGAMLGGTVAVIALNRLRERGWLPR